MLFKQKLGLVAMGQSLAWAHPASSVQPSAIVHSRDTIANIKDRDFVSLKKPTLEDKQVAEACQVVQTAIQLVGAVPEEYKGYALATTSASLGIGGAAWGACQAVNGQNCGGITAAIAGSVFSIGVGVSINLNMPIKGTEKAEITNKRDGGGGFTISYDFYHAESAFAADEAGVRVLADSLAADWANRADADHSMGEYFADLDFGGAYNVAIRITPETGTSENFQDPQMCDPA